MARYRLFGESTELFPIAQLIMSQDIDALEKKINIDWAVNQEIDVSKHVKELPINIALIENKLDVLDYLLTKKVDLNQKESPAIVAAVKNCSANTIKKLIAAGAKVDQYDRAGKNAISAALYSERLDLLPLLVETGLRVDSDGGKSFRQAVSNRQIEAVEFFIRQGIDANLRKPDMVFPSNPTAVAVAAQNNDFDMVKYLVAHGADVKLTDQYGERPYLYAVANNNEEMQAFLKNLEPKNWHDEENSAAILRSYNAPVDLINYLRQDKRRIDLQNKNISYIEFRHLTNVNEVIWKRRKFLNLLSQVDNHWEEGFLVWMKKEKKLASIDFEHDEIKVLCNWPQFVSDPNKWIESIFNSEP